VIIRTNVPSLFACNSSGIVAKGTSSAQSELGTGRRVNIAADDAAGAAISEKLKAQIRGTEQAARNTQDGLSMVQTAQGGLQTIVDMTHRIRDLSVQAANDTLTSEDRDNISGEIDQLRQEITKTAQGTSFNGQNLLATDDAAGTGLKIHVSSQPYVEVTIERSSITSASLGLDSVDVKNAASASQSLIAIDKAMDRLATEQTKYGSYESCFGHITQNLGLGDVNITAANSRIVDVDLASATLEVTRQNILTASTTFMMANTNQRPENVLTLLTKQS